MTSRGINTFHISSCAGDIMQLISGGARVGYLSLGLEGLFKQAEASE